MVLAVFEHINLNILDHDTAFDFYVTGLGGKVNEPSTNKFQLHINVRAGTIFFL